MTIKIEKYEIPNTALTAAGDIFDLQIPLGAQFMTLKVNESDGKPYLYFVIDTTVGTQLRHYIYANDQFQFASNNAEYIGEYSTTIPLNSFFVFEWFENS